MKRLEFEDVDQFEKGVERCHNDLRAQHRVPALHIRYDLSQQARRWAKELARLGRMEHSKDNQFGENLAYTTNTNPTPEEIVQMWYSEKSKYSYKKAKFNPGTGHFTQLVWKDTTHIGVGIARSGKSTYIVANYDPPGNYAGRFKDNVFKELSDRQKQLGYESNDTSSSSSDDEKRKRHEKKKDNKLFGGIRHVKNKISKSRKSSTSSSSSADSSDDEKVSGKGYNQEVSVDTKVQEYKGDHGRKIQKTTKVTTTVTTQGNKKTTEVKTETITQDGGKKSTKTKTETHTEYLSSDAGKSSQDARLIGEKIRKVKVGDDYDRKIKPTSIGFQPMTSREIENFESDCIQRHNVLRKRHGASSLTKNRDLTRKAQKWAEHLVKIRKLQHSSGSECGENIAYKFASDLRRFKGSDMVDMWYDEIKDYDFRKPGFKQTTGHFTQVVWAGTREIGIGVAYDGKGTCFCVANYLPHGNVQGRFEQNVQTNDF